MRKKFGELELQFEKMNLRSYLPILPRVGSAMLKLGLGELDFFKAFQVDDIHALLDSVCKFCKKITREQEVKPLTLVDLDDHVEEVMPILIAFLSYNFDFFLRAKELWRYLTNKNFQREEEKK